jgi:hypothetical protein
VSGHPDPGDHPMTVGPTDPELERKAALNAAYRLHRRPLHTKKREVLELLQMCGLAPYEAAGAKVNATTGQTEYAATAETKAKARVRKQAWRQDRKDAS